MSPQNPCTLFTTKGCLFLNDNLRSENCRESFGSTPSIQKKLKTYHYTKKNGKLSCFNIGVFSKNNTFLCVRGEEALIICSPAFEIKFEYANSSYLKE